MNFPDPKEIHEARDMLPIIFPEHDEEPEWMNNILVGMIVVRNRAAAATARIITGE